MSRQATLRRELPLSGGTTNAGLVSRVGDTVRRPNRRTGTSTRALLDHLERVGFDGAPRHLGIDSRGREVLTYIAGQAPIMPTPAWALSDDALVSVAQLLRRYHDAVASFDATGSNWEHTVPTRFRDGVISHNDPNLDNVIFRNGRAVALIDFDLASPGSRGWDLACASRLWVPLRHGCDLPVKVADRLFARVAMFADAYGADRAQRFGLVAAAAACHDWCYAIIRAAVDDGHETFSSQWHGGGRARAERTGTWLADNGPQLRAALRI